MPNYNSDLNTFCSWIFCIWAFRNVPGLWMNFGKGNGESRLKIDPCGLAFQRGFSCLNIGFRILFQKQNRCTFFHSYVKYYKNPWTLYIKYIKYGSNLREKRLPRSIRTWGTIGWQSHYKLGRINVCKRQWCFHTSFELEKW